MAIALDVTLAAGLAACVGRAAGLAHLGAVRPRLKRREDGARVRASQIASDPTYGARRVWHDLLAEGYRCGLHHHTLGIAKNMTGPG